jgi:hypothetical protein
MRRALALVVVLGLSFGAGCSSGDDARSVDLTPFAGLGTWVDVFDYVPGFQTDGGPPPITAASVDDMAALGITTLYLQAAQDDARITGATVDAKLLGKMLRRAHDRGMRVVAWYLPKFVDVDADLDRIRALYRFRSGDERFDAIALDVEWTQGVPDPSARNDALVELSQRTRDLVGDEYPLGAIVLEPLLLEQVNPRYWPGFPWRRIHDSYDVWLPMMYWTNRNTASGLKDGFTYGDGNIRLLRTLLDDDDAVVHALGGIADSAVLKDYEGFVRAARRNRAIGISIYDFTTTTSAVWAHLGNW